MYVCLLCVYIFVYVCMHIHICLYVLTYALMLFDSFISLEIGSSSALSSKRHSERLKQKGQMLGFPRIRTTVCGTPFCDALQIMIFSSVIWPTLEPQILLWHLFREHTRKLPHPWWSASMARFRLQTVTYKRVYMYASMYSGRVRSSHSAAFDTWTIRWYVYR